MKKENLNILVHSIYFPPEVGGLESHIYTLAKTQIEKGHSVHVVTSRSGDFPKTETMGKITVERRFCPNKRFSGWLTTTLAGIPAMKRKFSWADICHVHTFPSIIPAIKLHRKGIPLVASIHTSHFVRLSDKKLWRPILKKLLSYPDVILTASKTIQEICRGFHPSKPIYALVNATDTGFFKPVEPVIKRPSFDTKMLFIPSRLYEIKGIEYAIRALPTIRNKQNVHLYIVGDGPLRGRLDELSASLGIQEFIHFLGTVPHIDMPGIISSADLVVLPSLMEATSIAALEAMSCEKPIIASDVGGLPEIIDDQSGILVPPKKPKALAEAILEMLSFPEEKRRSMGAHARERVKNNWSVNKLTDKVLAHYEEAFEINKRNKLL
ncbi:glycosyltransferase family 4 protein [bacterium]|nr:glycosyltransferase family 4 protein [bacterium]